MRIHALSSFKTKLTSPTNLLVFTVLLAVFMAKSCGNTNPEFWDQDSLSQNPASLQENTEQKAKKEDSSQEISQNSSDAHANTPRSPQISTPPLPNTPPRSTSSTVEVIPFEPHQAPRESTEETRYDESLLDRPVVVEDMESPKVREGMSAGLKKEESTTQDPPSSPTHEEKSHAKVQLAEKKPKKQGFYNLQCSHIYPDMLEVSTPILSSVMALDTDEIYDEIGRKTARGSQIMLRNMVNSSRPIHPVAFFSTIKHFESSGLIDEWGYWDFGFTSNLCLSWECSGYFQVDVRIEPDWSLDHVCGEDGLNILGLKGGPDFCAALFWWTQAAYGSKCRGLSTHQGGNPCWDPGYNWTVHTFETGYKVYDQHNQWAHLGVHDSWGRAYTGGMVAGEYFMGYENCAAAYHHHKPTPENHIRRAVADFAKNIGITPS